MARLPDWCDEAAFGPLGSKCRRTAILAGGTWACERAASFFEEDPDAAGLNDHLFAPACGIPVVVGVADNLGHERCIAYDMHAIVSSRYELLELRGAPRDVH